MLKKLSVALLAVLFIASCAKTGAVKDVPKLTVAGITADAADYVDKVVSVTGNVAHVCHHSGKRLFLTGEDVESRFKVVAGESIEKFDIALEGSDITITGLIREQRVDKAFLDEWEADVSEEAKPEVGHEGDHDASALEDHHESSLDKIKVMRKKLAESEKEYLAFYSLECQSFEVVEKSE